MPDFKVTLTYTGKFWTTVEAENEDAAKEICFEQWLNATDDLIDNDNWEYTVEEVW